MNHLETLEKKNPGAISEKEEERALQRYLRELDRKTLDDIQRRFGRYIPPSRLERLRQQPAFFLKHEDYERHLQASRIRASEHERILGDSTDDRVHIDRNDYRVPRTLAHERLHQVSDKLYRAMLGKRINDGTTELFASELRRDLNIASAGKCYPQELRLMEMIRARVGEDTIARAYFQGDWLRLQRVLDSQLGDGALARIRSLAEQGRFAEAEEVIKKGLRR